ncbi:DUF397 domain-containing protein [Streptomyces tibetensis]|uniref:DUF397 domain-containing protein n=1 Tax=Streptomyces tibetensis TaxID=2382123 RepID=A0ABW6MT68_9ACTN
MGDRVDVSGFGNAAGGECVACALTGDGALVRGSKMTETRVIVVTCAAWSSFVQAVKRASTRP